MYNNAIIKLSMEEFLEAIDNGTVPGEVHLKDSLANIYAGIDYNKDWGWVSIAKYETADIASIELTESFQDVLTTTQSSSSASLTSLTGYQYNLGTYSLLTQRKLIINSTQWLPIINW